MSVLSFHKKRQQLQHLKASVTLASDLWDDTAVLGITRPHILAISVPYNVHQSVAAMGCLNLCLFAANGVRADFRGRGILTSFGSMFYAGKKAGKSNYTDLVYDNADRFQLWLNAPVFRKMEEAKAAANLDIAVHGHAEAAPDIDDDALAPETTPAKPTICVFKNVGPEEMLARCSPTRPGRLHWAAIRAEAEMATFLEQVNLLGTGGQNKKYEHQGSLNELFDTGAPSKLYRDASKNYGADLFAKWKAQGTTQKTPQMALYHTGCLNIAQAFALISEEEGLHAMALLERYIMAPLLPVNPYADPPESFQFPQNVVGLLEEDGTLTRDANGLWRRDLFQMPTEAIEEGMQRVWNFFDGEHNCMLAGSEAAKELLRLIDSHNFEAAEKMRYVDENKSARLAQMQRFMADFTAGHYLLDIFIGQVEPMNFKTDKYQVEHVQRAACHLAWLIESHETFVNPKRVPWVKRLQWIDPKKNEAPTQEIPAASMRDQDWQRKDWNGRGRVFKSVHCGRANKYPKRKR